MFSDESQVPHNPVCCEFAAAARRRRDCDEVKLEVEEENWNDMEYLVVTVEKSDRTSNCLSACWASVQSTVLEVT